MRRKFLSILAVLVTLTILAQAPRAADKEDELVENPLYKGWASFKPGTTVTHKEVVRYKSTLPGADELPEGIDAKEVNYKLVSVDPNKVVVRTVLVQHDALSTIESAPTRITYPAKVKRSYLEELRQKTSLKKGTEDVKVLGKTYKCTWLEFNTPGSNGEVNHRKSWRSPDMPGGTVKQKTVTKKGSDVVAEGTVDVIAFEIAP